MVSQSWVSKFPGYPSGFTTPYHLSAAITALCFLYVVLFILKVSHKNFSLPSTDMGWIYCTSLTGRLIKSRIASWRNLQNWVCSICFSRYKIPPRSSGIWETHLVPPGQPSDLEIEQSGDTISWHLGEGCVGGLAFSTLVAVNFQTWVSPMESWPFLPSLPLQPPGKHSVFLN